MFTFLTTKHSKIMVEEELTDDNVWLKTWAEGGGGAR